MQLESSEHQDDESVETTDLSGGEYLAQNDRGKTFGVNNVPHRPVKPVRKKQLHQVRKVYHRTIEEDAG